MVTVTDAESVVAFGYADVSAVATTVHVPAASAVSVNVVGDGWAAAGDAVHVAGVDDVTRTGRLGGALGTDLRGRIGAS